MKYQFKVGDKGKTTNGVPYEIVSAMVPPYENHAFLVKFPDDSSGTFWRNSEGKTSMKNGSLGNLLPPTRTVYVNLYEDGEMYRWYKHPTREAAIAKARNKTAVAVAVPVEIQG